ncbi:MAG TPA: hypothetical protein PKE26_13870 [Kiritimatiellia bacterium]|nr:hypothetical protein [Kiritimatiellia bacterium]HMP00190.1 hypothetical protein [Kiritimatiellia bacterium]HMP96720.1 hypothetical protein [Kiritimatiellia bacterium]
MRSVFAGTSQRIPLTKDVVCNEPLDLMLSGHAHGGHGTVAMIALLAYTVKLSVRGSGKPSRKLEVGIEMSKFQSLKDGLK